MNESIDYHTKWSQLVVSDSFWPHGLYPTRLLHPWNFPCNNTRVGYHFLLQSIFPTQGLNPGLLHCRQMLYHLSHQGSSIILSEVSQKYKEKHHMLSLTCSYLQISTPGLPKWCSGEESTCQCKRWKRCGFDPWVGKIPWRRKWKPTPVFLPGKSDGQRSLAGYIPMGHKESDKTEHSLTQMQTLKKWYKWT